MEGTADGTPEDENDDGIEKLEIPVPGILPEEFGNGCVEFGMVYGGDDDSVVPLIEVGNEVVGEEVELPVPGGVPLVLDGAVELVIKYGGEAV